MNKLVIMTEDEFLGALENVIMRAETSRLEREKVLYQREKLFTINKVAKRLGRAHATITRLVGEGLLKTTPDGLISENSINEYLKNA